MVEILILLIVLNGIVRLSLWPAWGRCGYSLALALFAYWSAGFAVGESKTEWAARLSSAETLQTMAILVTIEMAICLSHCFYHLDHEAGDRRSLWATLLHGYPSLLLPPAVYYILTLWMFDSGGLSFGTIAVVVSTATFIVPLLASTLLSRLLPIVDSRVEAHLLLTAVTCAMGLLLTQQGEIVYQSQERPVDWTSAVLTLALFLLLIGLGVVCHHIYWKYKHT